MKGLVLKDLLDLKNYIRQYVLTIVFFGVIGFAIENVSYAQALCTLYLCMLPVTAFSLDERSGWERYALTLPVRRRDLVTAKYIIVLIAMAASFLLDLILTTAILARSGQAASGQAWIASGLTLYAIMTYTLIFCGLLLPITFKLGSERARMVIILIVLLPIAASFTLGTFVDLEDLAGTVFSMATSICVLAGIFAAAVLFFGMSYKISCGIYDKKEF